MKGHRTVVNIIFILLGLTATYLISLLGKNNWHYYLVTYFLILLCIAKVKLFAFTEFNMIPTLFSLTLYFLLFLYFAQEDIPYATSVFLIEASFVSLWLTSWGFVKNKYSPVILGYFKTKNTEHLINTKKFNFVEIHIDEEHKHDLDGIVYDEIVAHDENARLYIVEKGIKEVPLIKLSDILERTAGKITMEHIKHSSFSDFTIYPFYTFFKRFLDIVITLIASPFILFFMLCTAIGVKIDSKGPAIFVQERTGKGDVPFKMYKFRSMIVESEKDGAKFAKSNDSRVTKFGKFIRKYRLDELPQFLNILKGDMSLIGPRPEQKVFTDKFNHEIPFYPYRHAVRPGITGWAQVSQGYAATVEDTHKKVEYDLYYIKNFSVWLDLVIALKTVKTIFTGFGAR